MNNDIYKDRYDFEWNHRAHILGVTNICIVAVTVIGSGLVAEAKSFNYDSASFCWFILFWGLSATSVVAALYFIFRALVGYGYSHIATPSELQSHYQELIEWCKQKNHRASRADEELEIFINSKMAEAVDVNLKNNKRKSAYNQKGMISIFIALMLLMLSAIPYLYSVSAKDSTQKVKIIDTIYIEQKVDRMTDNDDKKQGSSNQNQAEKPKDDMPKGPQNTIIKEHKERGEKEKK